MIRKAYKNAFLIDARDLQACIAATSANAVCYLKDSGGYASFGQKEVICTTKLYHKMNDS